MKKVRKRKTPTPKRLRSCAPDYELDRDGVTQSMLSQFINCRKSMEYSLQGWHQDRPKDALFFGSAFHWFLETLYVGKLNTKQILIKGLKLWAKKGREDGVKEETLQLFVVWLGALFEAYVEHYKKADAKRKWVELEGVFDVDFEGYRLRGRRDGLYQDKKGGYWLFENKTAGQINEQTLSSKLVFDFQNLFYINACAIDRNIKIKGVCYNVIRKPSIKQTQKETLKQYATRLIEDIKKRPKFYYVRHEVSYSQKIQKEFRAQLFDKLEEFAAWNARLLPTYRNEMACCAKWNCSYLEMCANSGGTAGYIQSPDMFTELED